MKISKFGNFKKQNNIFENVGLEETIDDVPGASTLTQVGSQIGQNKMAQAQPAKMAQAQTKRAQAQKKDSALQTPTDVYNFLMNADNLNQIPFSDNKKVDGKKRKVVEIDFYSETNSYALNGQTKFRVAETAPVSGTVTDEQKEAEAVIANGVKNGQKAEFKDGVFTMIEKLPQAQAQKTAPAQMPQMSNPAQGAQVGKQDVIKENRQDKNYQDLLNKINKPQAQAQKMTAQQLIDKIKEMTGLKDEEISNLMLQSLGILKSEIN
jgi:hypothetical protein